MNLSQQLAIAIGWSPNQFVEPEKAISDCVKILCDDDVVRHFSIKDKNLIWKLAERYNAFPFQVFGGWVASVVQKDVFKTPQEAVVDYIINVVRK